jgi:phosphopantothenoylcysteine decarboxylase/phosphopantothenate--cysteine ligase
VADFIPRAEPERMHREQGDRTLHLDAGPDLLASLAPLRRAQTVVAFAAETEDLEARGRRKMQKKGADLIVINDVGQAGIGFDADDNEVLILGRDGSREVVSRRPKRAVADKIWDAVRTSRAAVVGKT